MRFVSIVLACTLMMATVVHTPAYSDTGDVFPLGKVLGQWLLPKDDIVVRIQRTYKTAEGSLVRVTLLDYRDGSLLAAADHWQPRNATRLVVHFHQTPAPYMIRFVYDEDSDRLLLTVFRLGRSSGAVPAVPMD